MYGNSSLTNDPTEINQFLSKETNRSIVIPQDVLVKGRYTCFCSKVDLTATAGCFEVDLHSGMVPNFTVNVTEGIIPAEFSFHPETVYPDFGPTGLGTYCVNATAQGYPNVAYKWMYVNSDEEVVDASSDFCLSHPNGDPRILCFTPTPDNVDDQRSYTCNVSNIVGSITGSQVVIYPGNSKQSDWFLRKHESQTTGTVSSEVAYCAAYQEAEVYEIQYLVCSLPNLQDYSPNTLACLYAQGKLNCCACGEANCSLDISTSDVEVTDQLGVPTTACKVNASRLSGSYACIARKYVFMKGMTRAVLSAPQYLANFTFAPAPIHSGSNLTLPIWSVAVVLSVLGLLVLVIVLTIVATGIRFYHRRCQRRVREVMHGGAIAERDMNESERRPLLQQGGRVPRHDFGSLQLSQSDEEMPTRTLPIPTEEGDSPMKSVMVASQVHKPARIKVIDSNTKQEINESIVSSDCLPEETTYVLKPGNTYNVRMDNSTVKIVAPDAFSPVDLANCLSDECSSSPSRHTHEDTPFKPLPPNIDQLVPLSMAVLLPFVPKLAPKWDDIGYSLGLEDKVKVLRAEAAFPSVTAKMSMLFESWLETVDGVSWHNLVKVLRDIGYKRIAAHMCEFLHDQVHSLPQNVDKIVRVEMCVLVKIVSKIAPYWDRIGHHLKLTDLVTELRKSKSSDVVKMTILFEQWVERKDESLRWEVLLNILEVDLNMFGVGAKLREYILEAMKKRRALKTHSSEPA
jgi:hypothetical protein